MTFFSSKQFFNFMKNKNSFNVFNRNKIERLRNICFNKVQSRNYLDIKSFISSLLSNSLVSSSLFLSSYSNKLVKKELIELECIK